MAYEITTNDTDLVTFASERIGDLERLIREVRSLQDDIRMLDDDLSDCDLIDPDGIADALLDRLITAKDHATVAYNEACEAQDSDPNAMEYHCAEHGDARIVRQRTSTGFSGAPLYVADLSCGCQIVDDSADNAEAAR